MRIAPIVLFVVGMASPAIGGNTSEEVVSSKKHRFALAIVQGLNTFKEPGAFSGKSSFEVPILKPLEVMDEREVGGVEWVRVRRTSGRRSSGWVRKSHVYIWNNRHARLPEPVEGSRRTIQAFCDKTAVQAFVDGTSKPCLTFQEELLKVEGDKAPFPVLDVVPFRPERVGAGSKRFFHVLIPTTFSNIAPLKRSGSAAPSEILSSIEIILLIDATGSMRDEIAGAKAALDTTITRLDALVREADLKPKYMILAYRDTNGAKECAPIETPGGDKPKFVSGTEARGFLNGLAACEGGDGPEMIWDALEIVSKLEFRSGGHRALVLVGDAPATDLTRGGVFLGERVEAGLEKENVLKHLTNPLGVTTQFVALLAGNGLRRTATEVIEGTDFIDEELVTLDATSATTEVRDNLFKALERSYRKTGTDKATEEKCQGRLAYSGDRETALFCGHGGDDKRLAGRIADLMAGRKSDPIVLRDVWIPDATLFTDVALLSQEESDRTEAGFRNAAKRIKGGKCKSEGEGVWLDSLNLILPTKVKKVGRVSLLEAPPVSKRLHDYWGISVGKGKSILTLPLKELSELPPADCEILADRLDTSSNYIRKYRSGYEGEAFIWLPLEFLP